MIDEDSPFPHTAETADDELDELIDSIRFALRRSGSVRAHSLVDRQADLKEKGVATVVIVGEGDTGKSTLINELVGKADLLPEASGVATGTYCVITYAAEPAVAAHLGAEGVDSGPNLDNLGLDEIFRMEQAKVMPLQLDEVKTWASVDADPRPSWIEIQLDDSRLQGLGIVDTPGVNGLDGTLDDLALHALDRADAVVFVMSSYAPLGAAELEFLQAASQGIEHVIFVITKTEDAVDIDELINRFRGQCTSITPQFATAPFIAVSSKVARLTRSAGAYGGTPSESSQSGIDVLWSVLRTIADQRQFVTTANRLRMVGHALDLALAERRQTIDLLERPSDRRREIEVLRDRLAVWSERSARWRDELAADLHDIGTEVSSHLQKQRRVLLALFDNNRENSQTDRLDTPRRLIADLTQLNQDAHELVQQGLQETFTKLTQGLQIEDLEDLTLEPYELVIPGLTVEKPPSVRRSDPSDTMAKTQSFYFGTMMAHTFGGVVLASSGAFLASNPVGWATAAVIGGMWLIRGAQGRAQAADAAALRQWAGDTLNECCADIQMGCTQEITSAARFLTSTMTALVTPFENMRLKLRNLEEVEAGDATQRDLDSLGVETDIEGVLVLQQSVAARLARVRLELPSTSGVSIEDGQR